MIGDRMATAAISGLAIAAASYFGMAQPAQQGQARAENSAQTLEVELEAERQELVEHAANSATIRDALASCNQTNRELLEKLTTCLQECRP